MSGDGPARGLPGLEEIRAAHRRIREHIHRTPILSSRSLGEETGARVHLKPENLQRAGSFKIRGALNAILRAKEEGRIGPAGVLTFSSGNHGQGLALAARIAGVKAVVVVPEDILPVKREAILAYGAQVVLHGRTSEDRRERGEALAKESGAVVIPPFDHPDTIAGQGTIAIEILEDLPSTETIVVPIGGGGLIAGIALAAAALAAEKGNRGVQIVGAEPDSADSMRRSLIAGKPVTLPPSTSVADGLRAVRPGDLCFGAVRGQLREVVAVSDEAMLRAQLFLLSRAKLLVEPSGSAGVAALRERPDLARGRTVVAVLSGGNASIAAG